MPPQFIDTEGVASRHAAKAFGPRGFSRDRMHMANAKKVASAAMQVIDAMQLRYTSEEQVLGAAATFLIMCERFGIPAQDAFTATTNIMNTRVRGETSIRPEFLAVMDYASKDLI